ncbi:MAG TPA: DUF559 domain-containing protein, partial [Planctomycetota bacterium]
LETQFRQWRRPGFWLNKIRGNMRRDRRVNRALRKDGWRVLRVWESQVLKDVERCARRVHQAVTREQR